MGNLKRKQNAIPAYILSFKAKLEGGLSSLAEAARIYAEAVKGHPERRREFSESFQVITPAMFARLELAGSGKIHPGLLFLDGPKARLCGHLPQEIQREVIEEGVEVATLDGSFIKLKLDEMTKEQAALAISKNGSIRPHAAQRAIIECDKIKRKKAAPKRVPNPIRTTKTGVKICGQWEGTWLDLARVIGEDGVMSLVQQLGKLGR